MKEKIVLLFVCLFGFLLPVLGQEVEFPTETTNDYESYFATFAGIVAVTSLITEVIKSLFKTELNSWVQRVISWIVGILLGLFAWIFNLGMFTDLEWWQSLLWGFGAGLASNGLFDTGLIEWLFGLFTKKKTENKEEL